MGIIRSRAGVESIGQVARCVRGTIAEVSDSVPYGTSLQDFAEKIPERMQTGTEPGRADRAGPGQFDVADDC
jgi:hypothetical protein